MNDLRRRIRKNILDRFYQTLLSGSPYAGFKFATERTTVQSGGIIHEHEHEHR